MDVHIDLDGRGDLVARIYRQLLDAVLDGRLAPGERLPPTRELAARLEVSRNTVTAAYERLTAEGFLRARVGAGTFVCADAASHSRCRSAPEGGEVRPRQVWRDIPDFAEPRSPQPRYDFRVGVPDGELFPLATWRRLVNQALRRQTVGAAGYRDPSGDARLRAAIARYIGVSRSVRAGADDVLVTQGAQQALDLIARVLVEPGGQVAVEEPGYPPARRLFAALGAEVVGVPVDGEGIRVDAVPPSVRLIYVTPSHQFPLGAAMSLTRRRELLELASRRRCVIVEDDYDSEFRFLGRPLEPLQSLDTSGRVVYVGSFSKTLSPALRVGFLVAPASLRRALRTARQLTDWHGDPVTQAALARLIDEGLLRSHVRKATREYASRREAILTVLRRDFGRWLSPVPSAAGLHMTATLKAASTADPATLVARAASAGVAVENLADYYDRTPTREGIVLGYGAVRGADIEAGLARLAECC